MDHLIMFPSINREEIVYSNQLLSFFEYNNINHLQDDYFPLEKLNKIFYKKTNDYYKIKVELELKGFNFEKGNKFSFVYDVDWDNAKYIRTNKKGNISQDNLDRIGLLYLYPDVEVDNYEFLNFVPIERLEYLMEFRPNLLKVLKEIGFEIFGNDSTEYSTENSKNGEEKEIINSESKVHAFEKETNELILEPKVEQNTLININDIYNVFVNNAIIFGMSSNNDFINYKHILLNEDYDNLKNNQRLKDYLSIFNKVNYYSSFFQNDFNKYIKLLNTNKAKFVEEAQIYNLYIKLHKSIVNIDEANNVFFIINLVHEKLKKIFMDNNIKTVDHLKEKSIYELYELFMNIENCILLIKTTNTLNRDIIEIVKEKYNESFEIKEEDKSKFILEERAKGVTLQEIGENLGVTRERIRQIESSNVRKLKTKMRDLNKYLKSFVEDGIIVTLDEVSSYIDNDTRTLFYIHPDADKDLDLFIFSENKNPIYYILNEFKESRLYILETDVEKFIKNNFRNEDLLLSYESMFVLFEKIYYKKGIYYFNKKVSLPMLYGIILKYHFNDYEGLSNQTIKEFKQTFFEIFNDDSIFDKTDRAVIARTIDHPNVILFKRGIYIYSDKKDDGISDELYEEMYSHIKQNNTIYVEALYRVFEEKLLPNTKNRFELHGKIKRKYPELYFSKDYVSVSPNPYIDWDKIILNYLKDADGIIDLDTFDKDLPELQGFNISYYLYENPKFISMFNKRFIHTDYLDIRTEEINIIKEQIDLSFEKQTLINGHIAIKIMQKYTYDLVKRNNVKSNVFAYHIIRLFLGDYYYFDYPNIHIDESYLKKGVFFKKNQYIIEKVMELDQISIIKIREIAANNNQEIYNMKEFLEYFYENGFMRINNEYIAKKERILNENSYIWAKEVEKLLIPALINGSKILISDIDFSLLPHSIKWNNHLLAHLLMNNSKQINVLTIGNQYNSLDYELEMKKYE